MELINGMEDYGSAPGGESIYKDSKGYYIVKWNPTNKKEYKKYISKKWKPDPNRTKLILKCKNGTKRCKWTLLKSQTKKVKKNKIKDKR